MMLMWKKTKGLNNILSQLPTDIKLLGDQKMKLHAENIIDMTYCYGNVISEWYWNRN